MNASKSVWIVIACGSLVAASAAGVAGAEASVVVQAREVQGVYHAVGTVRPRTVAGVMAQASGRLLTVQVTEGQRVTRGMELAVVENRQLTFRLAQAQRSVDEAEARRLQALYGQGSAVVAGTTGPLPVRANHSRLTGRMKQACAHGTNKNRPF